MLYLRIKGNSLWSMVKERTSLLENTKLIGISVSFLVFNRIFVRNFLSGNSLCVIPIAKFFFQNVILGSCIQDLLKKILYGVP